MASGQRIYGLGEVVRKLHVAEYEIHNLFRLGKLDKADFAMIAGKRIFTEAQVREIARLLGGKG